MQKRQLNIKLMPELDEKIELVSRILNLPKVEWVRNVLSHEAIKELETHKSFIAIEYMKGRISKAELVKLLGEEDAEEVDFIMKKTREDLKLAKELARKIK